MFIYIVLSAFMDVPEEPLGYFSTNEKAFEYLTDLNKDDMIYTLVKEIEPIKNVFENDYEKYNEIYNIMRYKLDDFKISG